MLALKIMIHVTTAAFKWANSDSVAECSSAQEVMFLVRFVCLYQTEIRAVTWAKEELGSNKFSSHFTKIVRNM